MRSHFRTFSVLRLLSWFVPAFICVLLLGGCSADDSTKDVTSSSTRYASVGATRALFKDVALSAGINFKHQAGDTGKFYIVESMGPGCAFLDYDNDDLLDIFLVQSGPVVPPSGSAKRPLCALYRNNGDGTFKDVTRGSGLDKDLGYGQGTTVGDYDNDGYDDLFVTAYGGNHLFRNQRGTGKFKDVTQTMGLDTSDRDQYATSAAFGDYDNDGQLDLYVCNYVHWTLATNKPCRSSAGVLDYCSPSIYEPQNHRLYRNAGNRFMDVTEKAGITKSKGRGLAVAFVDYNADHKQDIFVANDVTPNMLWRNNGNGTFTDVAVETGCAYGENGRVMAAMGIAVADYNRSGRESFFVTNFSRRPNILFKNVGGLFEESTEEAHLFDPFIKFLTFGCEFFDCDADGWSDIVVNNGHVAVFEPQRESDIPYKQRKQLLRNQGNGTFLEITDSAELGELVVPQAGRGLAVGDYDNDGRIDILTAGQNAPAQLFRNRVLNKNHWISFKAVGTKSNRNGVHARFTIQAGKARQLSTVRGGSSYLSHSDRRVYFGLGSATRVDEVVIRWPSGVQETLKSLQANTFYTVTEGRGVTGKRRPRKAQP
jgi:hypothetical protein